ASWPLHQPLPAFHQDRRLQHTRIASTAVRQTSTFHASHTGALLCARTQPRIAMAWPPQHTMPPQHRHRTTSHTICTSAHQTRPHTISYARATSHFAHRGSSAAPLLPRTQHLVAFTPSRHPSLQRTWASDPPNTKSTHQHHRMTQPSTSARSGPAQQPLHAIAQQPPSCLGHAAPISSASILDAQPAPAFPGRGL
ncbi:hypothetical protein Taro_004491, partial [Colocasia esculenta]|nr:hypothetical protein [Colocasia esculenta]